jgi:hypothetical protein
LQHAKDANGEPRALLDELMLLLDDPPPGTGDRWQHGADFCAEHGFPTTRISVWRLYRSHILEWRREQAPPAPVPTLEQAEAIVEQARHLAAQRALEMLADPELTPKQLIAYFRHENQRDKVQLARDRFCDKITERAQSKLDEKEKRLAEMEETNRYRANFMQSVMQSGKKSNRRDDDDTWFDANNAALSKIKALSRSIKSGTLAAKSPSPSSSTSTPAAAAPAGSPPPASAAPAQAESPPAPAASGR